ncbi:MAG: hypothetical protein KIT10_00910 [Flavobacteriales bacterium]|nr:hypothetical protein [Flavobacteriales bacterium]
MRWDSTATGVVTGLLVPIAGFFLYALIHITWVRPNLDLHAFIHDLFLGTRANQAPILSLSLIANLAPFFLFDRYDKHKAMRGVITATLVYGVIIVVLVF